MMKQKDAVYTTIHSVLKDAGQSHEDGQQLTLSDELRAKVISILCTGFEQGKIELKSPQEDLKSYVGGLVSNWLRKDKRFNGGVKYQPANPGTRTGSQDPMVKNLRILLSQVEAGSEAYNAIETRINNRVAQIKAEKAKSSQKEVDFDAIPEDIKALL